MIPLDLFEGELARYNSNAGTKLVVWDELIVLTYDESQQVTAMGIDLKSHKSDASMTISATEILLDEDSYQHQGYSPEEVYRVNISYETQEYSYPIYVVDSIKTGDKVGYMNSMGGYIVDKTMDYSMLHYLHVDYIYDGLLIEDWIGSMYDHVVFAKTQSCFFINRDNMSMDEVDWMQCQSDAFPDTTYIAEDLSVFGWTIRYD